VEAAKHVRDSTLGNDDLLNTARYGRVSTLVAHNVGTCRFQRWLVVGPDLASGVAERHPVCPRGAASIHACVPYPRAARVASRSRRWVPTRWRYPVDGLVQDPAVGRRSTRCSFLVLVGSTIP
jgi:hypothetical protein